MMAQDEEMMMGRSQGGRELAGRVRQSKATLTDWRARVLLGQVMERDCTAQAHRTVSQA